MLHRQMINFMAEEAGLTVVEAPSGKYARLMNGGKAVAWVIPLEDRRDYWRQMCGDRSFAYNSEDEAQAFAAGRRGATVEEAEDGRWIVHWVEPCHYRCTVRLDLRRGDALDLARAERDEHGQHLLSNFSRVWRGSGDNVQVRVVGDGHQLEAAAQLMAWLRDLPAAAARAARVLQRLGLDRRFGVEVEFFGITRDRARATLRAIGLDWGIKADGSVRGLNTGVGVGLEMVTPPLAGEQGMEDLHRAVEALRAAGARVDRTCGVHVHMDVADCRLAGIKRFVESWTRNRPLISWLVAPSRRDRPQYCRAWRTDELEDFKRGRSVRRWGRYKDVNVAAFAKFGTVEVRLHHGTVEGAKITNWVRFCLALLDEAAIAREPLEAKRSLPQLLEDVGLNEDTKRYLLQRARRFSAPEEVMAS